MYEFQSLMSEGFSLHETVLWATNNYISYHFSTVHIYLTGFENMIIDH